MVSYSRSQKSLHMIRTSGEENVDQAICTPFAIGSSISINIETKSVARSTQVTVATVALSAATLAREEAVSTNSLEERPTLLL